MFDDMGKTLISVIVPVYNGEGCIANCIDALLANDYSQDRFEVVVVDNNSSDRSAQIIRRFLKPDYPVKYLKETRRGASFARNTGASLAKGDILAFIDSDAYANTDWLESIEQTFMNPSIDGVMGVTLGINRNLWAAFFHRQYEEFFLAQRKREQDRLTRIDTKNFAIKKSVFLKVGGLNPTIRNSEDIELGLRLYSNGYKLILNEKMVVRHLNPTDLETDIRTKREQTFFDYRIALSYSKLRNYRRAQCTNDPFDPRYGCLSELLSYRDKKFLVWRVTFLKYALPPLIRSFELLLNLFYTLGFKNKLYKWYIKTIGLAGWHGLILSLGSDMGLFPADSVNDSSLFKRAKSNN